MRRREFITLLGGAAAWPLAARAQQRERMRRIGVLMPAAADDPECQARLAAFLQGLQQLGWTDRPQRADRHPLGARPMPTDIRRYAAELVALAPDVILASGAAAVGPLLQATRTVPIVFAIVADPVGAGFVDEPGAAGRQCHRLHVVRIQHQRRNGWNCSSRSRRRVTRAAVLRDPAIASGIGQFGAIQAVAPSLGVEVSPVNVRDAAEIERAIAAFARSSNGGLIVTASALAAVHRDLIITLAARHKLPAVYSVPLLRHRRRPDLLRA